MTVCYAAKLCGTPVPKGRPRLGKGRVYTPSRTRAWETELGLRWRSAFRNEGRFDEGPVSVSLVFYVEGKRGDLDNYVKAVLDGLNGIAWRDDSQVERIEAEFGEVSEEEPSGVYVEVRDGE